MDSQQQDQPQHPMRSVHTTSFPALLKQLHCSLLVTTYQAGKLIVVRADNDVINTHLRAFAKPMGLAVAADRFAIGTAHDIQRYANMPAVARKLDPPDRHDSCFLPRGVHTTGDIDVHEMAWASDGTLWFVNTRFSCLCTLDNTYSFIPRWRPPFVTALSPEDRCHLNGLGMRDGKPRYMTTLGHADTSGGWREHKANGGMLMDIGDGDRVIAQGLSMPHSPRWYDDRLWLLESGNGSLATVDPSSGKLTTIAELPGFTRGLDFYGPFAFIGLSQVRESSFSGIPLTERLTERTCGVWVVDVRNGSIVAFLKFEDAVQEIFAVSVVPRVLFPEVLEPDDELLKSSYMLPDEALADVPEDRRS